jgi:hypothetical protein
MVADDIRVERPLRQEIEMPELPGFDFEHIDEGRADDLALLLRIRDMSELREEDVGRIDEMHRQLELLVTLDDLRRLIQAQQPVVDEDALQLIADRAVNQCRRHGGVDAARQTADHTTGAHPLANATDGFVDEGLNGPVAGAAADVKREVAKNLLPPLRVGHLGVKQQRVKTAVNRLHCCHWRVGAGRNDVEAWWGGGDEITVARPDAQLAGQVTKEPCGAPLAHAHRGETKFPMR